MGQQGAHPTPVRFRSGDPVALSFDSWKDYTKARGPGSLVDVVLRRDAEIGFSNAVPWLTFVLGSGCLSSLPDDGIAEGALRTSIEAALDELPAQHRLDGDVELTEVFLRALIEMKLEQRPAPTRWLESRSTDSSGVLPWTVAIQICLLAAIATRAYTALVSVATPVLDRSDREEVLYSADETPELTRIFTALVAPMDELRARLEGRDPDRGEAWASFKALLKAMGTTVDGKRVFRRQHVELLAAFAWHFLTDGTAIYPGWSDILLFHAFDVDSSEFEKWPAAQRPRKRSPALRPDSWMYQRLKKVTQRSVTTPEPFYERVATVLDQQARVLSELYPVSAPHRPEPLPTGTPHATAFITSFDIELEMALASRSGQFAIVLPVVGTTHPGDRSALDASIHWLYRIVSLEQDQDRQAVLTELLEPGDWRRMPENPMVLPHEMSRMPIVVHLAGAPLFSLPQSLPGVGRISHALLLDETIAIMQFGAEVRGTGSDRLSARLLDSHKMPSPLVPVEPAPRFWAFVGNPHSDPAVRLRLLASGWNTFVDVENFGADGAETDHGAPRQSGVVVNRWVPLAESESFRWQGFDVVPGETTDLIAELEGYAARVEDEHFARVQEAQDA